jgi:hypothetical protein
MSDHASKALAEPFLAGRASNVTMPDQNVVESLCLPFIIVRMGDARKKRRPKAKSISLHQKRKPLKRV